jgi:hypothetical protein
MTSPSQLNTSSAEMTFVVANTPLFLLRKLRSDPVVVEMSTSIPAAQIFKALQKSIRRKPKTIKDSVRPYVYLVALSLLRDQSYLRQAATLSAPHAEWFTYLAKILTKTNTPTSNVLIQVPNTVTSFVTSKESNLPASQKTLRISDQWN